MKTVFLEEMTSPEVCRAIEAGFKTVIVPAGSTEQHGKHLPLGTDAMIGAKVSEQIARGLGDALVAPVIRPGCSDHHMPFAGTITISPELLKEIVRATCRCLSQHGFERIVLLATHGGNIKPLGEAARELDAELPCRVVSPVIIDHQKLLEATTPVLEKHGVTLVEGGVHAGFTETIEMLASKYQPLVDMRFAERGFTGDVFSAIDQIKEGKLKMPDVSPNGILGDATRATAEAGYDYDQAAVPIYIQIVKDALAL